MNLDELAALKARVKRLISGHLAELPQQAQADVLADLRFAVISGEIVTRIETTKTTTGKTKPGKTAATPNGGAGLRPGTKATAVYNALKAHPRCSFSDMAKAAYGRDDENAIRGVRAILNSLAGQGLVKNVGHGQWEVA